MLVACCARQVLRSHADLSVLPASGALELCARLLCDLQARRYQTLSALYVSPAWAPPNQNGSSPRSAQCWGALGGGVSLPLASQPFSQGSRDAATTFERIVACDTLPALLALWQQRLSAATLAPQDTTELLRRLARLAPGSRSPPVRQLLLALEPQLLASLPDYSAKQVADCCQALAKLQHRSANAALPLAAARHLIAHFPSWKDKLPRVASVIWSLSRLGLSAAEEWGQVRAHAMTLPLGDV